MESTCNIVYILLIFKIVFDIIILGDNMKRGITILVMLIVLNLLAFGAYFIVKGNMGINKDKTIGEVVFKNPKIKKTGNQYSFKVTLKCKGDKADIDSFDAIIKNKRGKEIDVLSGYVGGLKKGETKIIQIKTDKDLSDAYEINYTVYK